MVVVGNNKFKEVIANNYCNKCWFNGRMNCVKLRGEGLLPSCSEYHREDGNSIIFIDEFANLDVGSRFQIAGNDIMVCENEGCTGCLFEMYKDKKKCKEMQDAHLMPCCSRNERIDDKSVIFVLEKMKKVFISHPMKDVEDVEKFRAEVVAKTRKVVGGRLEIMDTLFKDEGKEPAWYLGKSIMAMAEADIVVFYKGWEKARGCMLEHEVAVKYGMNIVYVE